LSDEKLKKFQPKFLKISTVAADLDYTTRTIRQWIYDKKIQETEIIKINGSWRVSAAWLYEYVEKLKNEKIDEILEKPVETKSEKCGKMRNFA
jgi:hypothetical protein